MSTGITITIIVVLLIIGVGVSAYFQYREQIKAEKRQRIAKLRYKAREGQELYERFYEYPVGPHTRKVILQYIAKNLSEALSIDENQKDLESSLRSIEEQITNPKSESDNSRLQLPSDPKESAIILNRIKNLMRYIHKLGKFPGIDINAASMSLAHIKKLYIKLQARSMMNMTVKLVAEQNYLMATQYIDSVHKLLAKIPPEDAELPSLQQDLQNLLDEIKSIQSSTKKPKAETTDDSPDDTQKAHPHDDEDGLFQKKKKW